MSVYEHRLALSYPHLYMRFIVNKKDLHVWQLWILQFDVYTLGSVENTWLAMEMG